MLTGVVIDSACALWQDLCGTRGSCWFYDRFEMSWRLFVWWIAVKIFSAIMFLLSSKFYKAPVVEIHTVTETDVTIVATEVNGIKPNIGEERNGTTELNVETQI